MLIAENTFYIDAYMRLSGIYLTLGDIKNSEEYCRQALEKAESLIKYTKNDRFKAKSVDAFCMQAFIQSQTGNDSKANNLFSQIKNKF
mmetsp:Transcript_34755/g.31318  ORF Transcript_34755/g.31318 Transcript_34755/m.31318 type:complete len:88 (+) Transcript_34755:931-1194(+)